MLRPLAGSPCDVAILFGLVLFFFLAVLLVLAMPRSSRIGYHSAEPWISKAGPMQSSFAKIPLYAGDASRIPPSAELAASDGTVVFSWILIPAGNM